MDPNRNGRGMSPAELASHIEETHHAYLEQAMPQALTMLGTILRVHGASHQELFDIYREFGNLKTETESHRILQDYMLFPLLEEPEDEGEAAAFLSLAVRQNKAMQGIVEELSRLTNGYEPPLDACATFQKTYQVLKEIHKDFQEHLELENQVLFL